MWNWFLKCEKCMSRVARDKSKFGVTWRQVFDLYFNGGSVYWLKLCSRIENFSLFLRLYTTSGLKMGDATIELENVENWRFFTVKSLQFQKWPRIRIRRHRKPNIWYTWRFFIGFRIPLLPPPLSPKLSLRNTVLFRIDMFTLRVRHLNVAVTLCLHHLNVTFTSLERHGYFMFTSLER